MIPRAVIDTNVLVSAFWSDNWESPPVKIYHAIMDCLFKPIYNAEIIAEYDEVLHRRKFGFPASRVDAAIRTVREFGEEVTPAEPDTEDFPDLDDKVFYCVALAAQDDDAVLVTGNAKHFPPAAFVISPAEFVERVGL